MRTLMMWLLLSSSLAAQVACHGDDADTDNPARSKASAAKRWAVKQVAPPLDVEAPPADATKTASGLTYKKLVSHAAGAQPRSDETAAIRYTGWRRQSGETFFTTDGGQTIAIDIAHAAPGLREALPLLHKGEKAMLWLAPGDGTMEPVAYEVELVDVVAKPAGTGGGRQAAGAGSAV
jgi:FKBP-type peptidyl-prolyl cis-trans isomerase